MRSCRWETFLPIYLSIVVVLLALALLVPTARSESPKMTETWGEPKPPYRLLLLGEDEVSGLCDVIILANIDVEAGTVCLAQIPRDTYFNCSENRYKKINGAVKFLGGAEGLCRSLEEALALKIDGYVMVDLKGVQALVDMLGGVEIDVPCDMDYRDPEQGLSIHLKKGRQQLTGQQAVQFIRYRSGYVRGDLGRVDAQKLFLAAFLEAARQVENRDVPKLASVTVRFVRTNVGISQGISLFRAVREVTGDRITVVTLPGEEIRSEYSGAWYYVLSKSGTADVLDQMFGVSDAKETLDSAHRFSDGTRTDFETIYRRDIVPKYYTAESLRQEGLTVG